MYVRVGMSLLHASAVYARCAEPLVCAVCLLARCSLYRLSRGRYCRKRYSSRLESRKKKLLLHLASPMAKQIGIVFQATCQAAQFTQPFFASAPPYRTPIPGARGPSELELLFPLISDESPASTPERLLSPLPALALAEPVRLRTCELFEWGFSVLTPDVVCSICCGTAALLRCGIGCLKPGGLGRPFGPFGPYCGPLPCGWCA